MLVLYINMKNLTLYTVINKCFNYNISIEYSEYVNERKPTEPYTEDMILCQYFFVSFSP